MMTSLMDGHLGLWQRAAHFSPVPTRDSLIFIKSGFSSGFPSVHFHLLLPPATQPKLRSLSPNQKKFADIFHALKVTQFFVCLIRVKISNRLIHSTLSPSSYFNSEGRWAENIFQFEKCYRLSQIYGSRLQFLERYRGRGKLQMKRALIKRRKKERAIKR